ncbi:MAG: protein kinase, partial [Desulfatitalea sp.]|nr:protein kinase [Desulfatitalea sp.]
LAPNPLLARLLGMGKLRDLFVAEARAMAALRHPNIVAIHDFDDHLGAPFYVMDFYANNLGNMMGETFRVEAPSRVLAVEKALDYTRQTLAGLACLHDAGMVHRDIKPFNLLVTARDTVKICDFGLSKLRGETFQRPANLNVGSPYYAAPEQASNPDAATPAADLYAVGIICYRMLTGRLPAAPPHPSDYRPPSHYNPDLDAPWDRFFSRAIDQRPERRFPHAIAMMEALGALADRWQARKESTCALPPPTPPLTVNEASPVPPRTAPIKTAPRAARHTFGLDPLWRPARYAQTALASPRPDIVVDPDTRLIWQQSGNTYPRNWQGAQAYIDGLNRMHWGGKHNWRLPTIDELLTLLRPTPQIADLCQPPAFDTTQRWIWSADRRSFTAAYYVDMVLGFVGWQDFSAPYYVRAVSSR